ncbi:hypothetical protein [Cellulomonas fimi]|uniref:hypothetical protein n=1 Tax=Cellulomonas fimi TaxID=1708 RepID=UPI002359408E|nr:hypothetical protein [Cellulomonas fimi]
MPAHAVAGHLVVIVAPLTALLALVYAAAPRTRTALRVPLVAVGAVTFALALWAGAAGGDLLDQLESAAAATGQPLPAEVRAHAKGSDALTVAVVVLGVAVLATVWGVLRPRRPATTGARIAAGVVAVAAVAVLVTTATVLTEAMGAVWATHGLWSA